MVSARSLANQKLYYARILAKSWRLELQSQSIPANVLAGAFNDPACQHLRAAYGWFLLEIVQPPVMPTVPPVDSSELPVLTPGKALPGEVRELQQLEQSGWIAQMLQCDETAMDRSKSLGNLALSVTQTPHPDTIDRWIEQLESIFARMADSLDEY
jgi:hypothetical protein